MNKKSGHWQNTGLARFINDNLYHYNTSDEKSMNPMKWYSINNGGEMSDTRECINGFPCRLILVNDGTTPLLEGQAEPTLGNTKDMGIFNFNNDKSNTDTMGLDNKIFPNCLSFEVASNSDTSAGAFIPCTNGMDVFYNSKYSSYFSAIILNDTFYPNGNSATLTCDAPISKIDYFDSSSTWKTEAFVSSDGTVEYLDYDYVQIKFSGTAPKIVTLNGITYSVNIIDMPVHPLETPLKEGQEELAYLQDSFELRYPNADDYGADYGYLGMEGKPIGYKVDYWIRDSRTYTTQISVNFIGTTFTVSGNSIGKVVCMDSTGNNWIGDVTPLNGVVTVLDGTSYVSLSFNKINSNDFEDFYVNGELYRLNEPTPRDTIGNPVPLIGYSQDYGLKRVIDWVGNANQEEFVADFEQYFNKQYTLRYYLIVILLAMVDNLG